MTVKFNHFAIKIKKRQFNVNLPEDKINSWANNAAVTAYFNAFSSVLPFGERVLLAAIKNFKNEVRNPSLKKQVDDFIYQEAHHVGVHNQYNELLLKQGYKLTRMNRALQAGIFFYTKILQPRQWLAIMVAYEHMIACQADFFFRKLNTEKWDSNFLEVWRFHMAEEIEHKSVAFDMYAETSGSRLTRYFAMIYVSCAFTGRIIHRTFHFLRKDRQLWQWQTLIGGSKFLFGYQGLFWNTMKGILQYMRPGFHPWQYNNYYLVTRFDKL